MAGTVEKALDLFAPPVEFSNLEDVEWQEFRPTTQFTPKSKVVFDINGSPNFYYDLKRSTLRVKARLLKEDGSVPMSEGDNSSVVSPVNLPLHSMWSQLEVALQQRTVTKIGPNHPYKAYIDVLLNTTATQKNSSLINQLFYMDTPGAMDTTNPNSVNEGLYRRYFTTKDGKVICMEGPLYDDLAEQDRYILNGVPLKISLWPSTSAFCLMAEQGNYKLEIHDVAVNMCCVRVAPEMLQAHDKMLGHGPALYPLPVSDIKTFNVPRGQYSLSVNDVYQGKVPQKLIVAMVSSQAYTGSYDKNPYNFQHFHLISAGFFVDGKSVPRAPLQTNFESGDVADGYNALIQLNEESGITPNDYKGGFTLLTFDLSSISRGPSLGIT